MFVILIILSSIAGLYLYFARLYKYWERKGAKQSSTFYSDNIEPSVKKWPLYEMCSHIYNRFPNERCLGFYQFTLPVLMLRDPELIKEICVKDFEYFLDHRPLLPDSEPLWDKNLFALRGHKWKEMRTILSPSFTGSKMRQMFVLMQECAQYFVEFISQNSEDIVEIEFKDAFTRYTNDVIASTAFGIKCDSLRERDNEFYVRGRQTTDFSGIWKNLQFMLGMVMPWFAKMLGISIIDKPVRKFFRKIIKETIEYREKNNVQRPDMINLLMNARKDSEENKNDSQQKGKLELTVDDITSQALLFFFAGFDTVSTVMCFMCYELATNPDIQERLVEELNEFRKTNQKNTYEGLAKLPYFDMVFSETIRKWPPTFFTDRLCIKPYTIEPKNPNQKPIHLTYNDAVWIPIWAIHHDPKYWENPYKFDPERFSPENKENIVPYTYVPFGVGPRNCIGSRFAIIEVKAIVSTLLEKFEIVPIEKTSIPFKPNIKSFTLASDNGFWLGLKRRTKIGGQGISF